MYTGAAIGVLRYMFEGLTKEIFKKQGGEVRFYFVGKKNYFYYYFLFFYCMKKIF